MKSEDIELLKRLKGLLDAGILTEEEFSVQKALVLGNSNSGIVSDSVDVETHGEGLATSGGPGVTSTRPNLLPTKEAGNEPVSAARGFRPVFHAPDFHLTNESSIEGHEGALGNFFASRVRDVWSTPQFRYSLAVLSILLVLVVIVASAGSSDNTKVNVEAGKGSVLSVPGTSNAEDYEVTTSTTSTTTSTIAPIPIDTTPIWDRSDTQVFDTAVLNVVRSKMSQVSNAKIPDYQIITFAKGVCRALAVDDYEFVRNLLAQARDDYDNETWVVTSYMVLGGPGVYCPEFQNKVLSIDDSYFFIP